MKIIVDKMPRYFCVEDDCIFAEETGKQICGKSYYYIPECKCKISGEPCELQYDDCPYLKEQEFESKRNM